MKKLYTMLIVMLITIPCFAQTEYFTAYQYSSKVMMNNGQWSNWLDWISTDINVKIDFDKAKIIIYSNEPQIYRLIEEVETPYDDGGQQIKYRMIDQDGDYGSIRFRKQYNGTIQLYIDYADIKWVYNIE
jgi:hypothetical protein